MPTDVAAGLPQLDLNEGTTITVTLDDPAAIITSLALHGWQEIPQGAPEDTVSPLLTVAPGETG